MFAPTACEAPQSVSPRESSPRALDLRGTDGLRLTALASADSNQLLDAQLEYTTTRSTQDVAQLARDGKIQIVGFSHAFRYKSQVQIGVFDLPTSLAGEDALTEYRKSTREFLRGVIRSTKLGLDEETDPLNQRSYTELLDAFRIRLAEFDRDKPGIYSLRVRGRAGFLAALPAKDKAIRGIRLPNGLDKKFPIPLLSSDIGKVPGAYLIACPQSALGAKTARLDGGVTVSSMPLPDPCEPPPGSYPVTPPPSGQGPPTTDTQVPQHLATFASVPGADPYNDDTYYDDNSPDNTYWAPTEGKSWVDRDAYSKYTIQHWLWKFPHLTLYKAACGVCTKFSFEGEVHQDGRNGQSVYANGLYYSPSGRGRGEVWESNFPSAYLDTQFLDNASVPNHTIGTTAPEQLVYDKFYYTWIRFSQYTTGASTGKVQVAVQLGDRDGWCLTPNGWCTLTSLSTVRVLPWICGYRAPNSLTMAKTWKRWYYDGRGYKNEQCRDTP
jgi:hypothetical protein